MDSHVQTDFLIVGAGPAGAAMAAFLGQNDMKGLAISKVSATADTPRAHTFNPFGFECLRDIGLEDAAMDQARVGPVFQSMRWCRSMVGEEYGKVRSWGDHPSSMDDTTAISPCSYAEFTQAQLEPLLIQYASHHNFKVRFSTEIVNIERVERDDNNPGFMCTVHDLISQLTFKIRTRYLFGADGARSHVARSLDFKFDSKPSGGKACNVLLRADLGHLLPEARHAGLHWILKPDRTRFFGLVAHLRAVRPWKEWVLVCFGPNGTDPFHGLTPESPELIDCVHELIGDESVDVEILRLDPWTVRENVAEQFSTGDADVFLLGDAAHRHPPAFGLGSNTCVQDAYNLAWKVAYVSKGLAGPGLLESYSDERQPVGSMLVRASNNGLRSHADIWGVLGMFEPSREEGTKQLAKLSQATSEGATNRAKLHDALEAVGEEVRSLGVAYNQWYTSTAVYLRDERSERPPLSGNSITDAQISTYPGSRLPHAWLDLPTRRKLISTIDLAGKGAFCLLLGIGGDAWGHAARKLSKVTGIPINIYGIGFRLNFVDVYRDWHAKRGVKEDGCVLIRPDRFVAWRSLTMVPDCERKLMNVFDHILCRGDS